MKWKKLKEIIDEEFPLAASLSEDYIGEQVKIKENIEVVMVTLDITLDVISQAKDKKVDLIIAHHPLFFGEKEMLLKNNDMLAAKYKILNNLEIGVYIIHTNADYNPNSIAFMQALAIGAIDITQGNENLCVEAKLKEEITAKEFIILIKEKLELNDVEFRSNFDLETSVSKILIASGAAGNKIDMKDDSVISIIGEVKHHEWVAANEIGSKVIEISHFSEKIFKNIVDIFLNEENITILLAEEDNGYKII